MTRLRNSTFPEFKLYVGGFLLLGLAVIAGWLGNYPLLTFAFPGFRPVTLVAAILFILSALLLMVTREHLIKGGKKRKIRALSFAAFICVLSALLIAKKIFDFPLGWFALPAGLQDYGKPSPGTLMGFFFSGLALLLLNTATSKRKEAVFQTIVIGVVASGLLGVFGQLSAWVVNLFSISFVSSVGVAFLGISIYKLAGSAGWLGRARVRREDSKISLIGGLIMMGFGLAISLVVIGLFLNHVEELLTTHLNNRLASDASRLEDAVTQRVDTLTTARWRLPLSIEKFSSNRPTLMEQVLLDQALDGMLSSQVTAVALYNRKGILLSQQGAFASNVEFEVPLKIKYPATLLWKDKFVLRLLLPAKEAGRVVGSYLIDTPLPLLNKLLTDIEYLGKSAEPAICAPYGSNMQCAPTRLTSRVIKIPRHFKGQPLPMSYALRGLSGTIVALDYRGVPVVAAYRPLPHLNLGMVIKVDAEELYRPQRQRAQKAVPIFIALLFISFMLLRWQVVPLVHKLGDAELRTRLIIDNLLDALITMDGNSRIVSANPASERIFGYAAGDIVGKNVNALLPLGNALAKLGVTHPETEISEGYRETVQPVEVSAIRKGGTTFPVEVLLSKMLNNGQIVFIAVIRDVSERYKHSQQLQLAARVINNTKAGVLIADSSKLVRSINPAFTELLGYTEKDIVGHSLKLIQKTVSDPKTLAVLQQMWVSLEADGFWQGEVEGKGKFGHPYIVALNMTLSKDANGNISDYIGVFNDIRETKKSEERIYHLAHYDTLTNLPNRLAFYDRLHQTIPFALRNENSLAILFLDLDRFKDVNDTLGHGVGDLVLRTVAQRIQRCLRTSDLVSRLGGDEFVVLLADAPDGDSIASVAQKILAAVAEKYQIAQQEFYLSASMGITIFPADGKDSQELVKNADVAMYRAKELGRNNFQFYVPDMNFRSLERLELQNSLYRALERDEFMLHYQPQIDTKTGAICSVEALLRWLHPQKGMISPGEFIPIAEDKGLIVPIGEWVLREACRQMVEWHRAGFKLNLAVNLSARQFRQENLIGTIQQVLAQTTLVPEHLELELTESYIMDNPEAAIKILRELSDTGVQLSVDDFGTGYSSLSYLKRFPIDTLKIDQSFVQEVASDSDSAAIVTAIIAMAASLKLQVVAEGVETVAQSQFLAAHGCTRMQGYLFSRPLPALELTLLLESNLSNAGARWKG